MLDKVRTRFDVVFVEKDDNPELVARHAVDYFPAYVWTDAAGEEITRTVQPTGSEELLEDFETAVEIVDDPEYADNL